MEEKNIETLLKKIEDLKKQVESLSKKIEEQEKESIAYKSEEYQKKLEKFLNESTWNVSKRDLITIDERSRSLIKLDIGAFSNKVKVIKLPEPDNK